MYKIELIKNFELFDVDVKILEHQHEGITSFKPKLELVRNVSNEFSCDFFHDFPLIVDDTGAPWEDVALFLLEYLKKITPPSSETLLSITYDLLAFGNWLFGERIDYLNIETEHRQALPTYRFRHSLQNSINSGDLKSSTARRRMNTICRFYSWLQITNRIAKRQLWISEERMFSTTHNGRSFRKPYESTDLSRSLKPNKMPEMPERYIVDGRRLRPLRSAELVALRASLQEIGNAEMSLAVDIAICTGARLETVFSLREGNFISSELDIQRPRRITIGGDSLVKNKKGKQMVLHLPANTYQKMVVYLKSSARRKRLSNSEHFFRSPKDEYAFLTKSGKAYVLAKDCPNRKIYDYRPKGNSITQFFHGTLRRKLQSKGFDFPLTFHDLRATFGVRLVAWERLRRSKTVAEALAPSEQLYLLNYLKERFGHSDVATALRYIGFEMDCPELESLQDDYENHLLNESS